MIYIILGRLTKAAADDYARPRDDLGKRTAVQREAEIRRVVEELLRGQLLSIYWTLGEYDMVLIVDVTSPEKAAGIALGLGTRIGMATTTLTGFDVQSLQPILDDGGYGGHT